MTLFRDSGGDVSYGYDEVNNLKILLEPGAPTAATFDYDENNRRKKVTFPTNPQTVVNLTYDDSGRQKTIKATAGTTTLTDYIYSYSKNGVDTALRQSVTDSGVTTTYGYDLLNRLTSASGGISRSYVYNSDFNRTSKTESGSTTSYTHNDPNQLTAAGSTTYTYDGNGNTTSSTSGWALTYNTANQTTSIKKPSGASTLSPLVYAGQDQTELVQAGTDTFVTTMLGISSAIASTNGGSDIVNEDTTSPKKGTTDYYTRDNSGNLISLRTGGTSYYYLVDGLGSVVGLVNSTGTKVNTYKYDPYGIQMSVSQTVSNPWRYAAGFYHGLTGMTKFGARYYNPELGRFTQRDPSGKDLPYAYAGCDPVNHTDPTGLDTGNQLADACIEGAVGAAFTTAIGAGITALVTGGVTLPAAAAATAGAAIAGCVGGVVVKFMQES